MDECVRGDAANCEKGSGRDSGRDVEEPRAAGGGAVCDGLTCMGASASRVGNGSSGMTIEPSERLWKILLTAIIPAAPVSALKSAPT